MSTKRPSGPSPPSSSSSSTQTRLAASTATSLLPSRPLPGAVLKLNRRDYVAKPIDVRKLGHAIREALQATIRAPTASA